MHNFYPFLSDYFVHESVGQEQVWLEKEDDWYPQIGSSCHLIFKILFSRGHPLVNSHIGDKCLHVFCPFREVCPHTSSPNFLVTNFPIRFLPKNIPNHPTKPLTIAHESMNPHLAISPFKKFTARCTAQYSAHWKFSLHLCSSGVSQERAKVL